MEDPRVREDSDQEEGGGEGGEGEDEAGPERALGKNALQLTAEDVYDISYVVGRELMALGSDPRVTQLQFTIVRVLELLEALVSEGGLAAEALRLERDSLRQEVRALRSGPPPPVGDQVDLGPDKMVVDLTDPNRPRFTLQELKEVLQERNTLKAQLLLAQEELLSYRSGLIPPRESTEGRQDKEAAVTRARGSDPGKGEKTIMKKLFAFRSGKQT